MDSKLVSDFESFAEDGGLSRPSSVFAYTKQFEKMCPYYLAIGMTYDQYWYGDCTIAKAYRDAHRIKQELDNQRCWLQGMYVYEAICCASPILRDFSKARKPVEYSKQPYDLGLDKERAKQRELNSTAKARQHMEMLMANINKNFKKGDDDG